MRRMYVALVVAIAVAMAGSGAIAATSFWLTTDPAGSIPAGNTVNVPVGGSVTLYCFMNAGDIGNTFEMMVGYDTSDATTYGAGKDTNNGAAKKLTLSSNQSSIVSSVDSFFDVFTTAGYANSQVVLDASGRENPNTPLGGRPYGFVARAAAPSNTAPGVKKLFSFTLANNMAQGQTQSVVVSNYAGGNSYSSAWKHGTSLFENAYALLVNSSGAAGPTMGANNKAVLDAIMTTAASNYTWVFWGKVSNKIDETDETFDIDDGSGVIIHVNGSTASTIVNGDYVSVKGSLDVGTKTITSSEVIERN